MSAAPSGRFTTRSEIEDLTTSDFADAAARWRTAADQSDGVFDRHRQNIAAPGGTTWEGGGKDAALERVTADGVVAGEQNRVVREAASIAEDAVTDINAAQREVLAAITETEADGFTVAEDLKVTDARRYDINTVLERNKAAKEHAEDIRWYAERLGQTVAFAEERLQEKAAELDGIRFEGEGESRDGEPTVRLVDNKVVQDKPDEDRKDEPGDKPAEQATGQVGPFAVPKAVEDAAKKPEDKPPPPPATLAAISETCWERTILRPQDQNRSPPPRRRSARRRSNSSSPRPGTCCGSRAYRPTRSSRGSSPWLPTRSGRTPRSRTQLLTHRPSRTPRRVPRPSTLAAGARSWATSSTISSTRLTTSSTTGWTPPWRRCRTSPAPAERAAPASSSRGNSSGKRPSKTT
ncbi:hypothetical protein ABQF35_30600 [Mycobacterium syngnathidarum]